MPFCFKKKILTIALFLTLLIHLNCFAQVNYPFGLEFNSREVIEEKRTTLDITYNHSIEFKNAFTVSYDICFRNSEFMGTIFEVLDKDFHSELFFIQHSNKDTAFLKLNFNNKPTQINYPIPKSILNSKKWFSIKINYDLFSKSITLGIDGKRIQESGLTLKSEINAKINFGLRRKYSCDTPPMSIRNLKIFDSKNNKIHEWLFNEIDGDIAHDNIGGLNAKVYNPIWLLPKHYFWNMVARLGPFEKANLPEINYDSENQRIVIVFKDFLYFYNTNKNSITKKIAKVPQKEFTTLYSNKHHKLYSQHSGQGKISTFDESKSVWQSIDTTGEHDGHYYGHNMFEDSFFGNLLMMNGYGWYNTKNHLQQYNFNNDLWKVLQLNGDYILPRRRSAISSVDSTGSFYLFGGFGNYSGKQEDGYIYLHDFYKINYRLKTVKKVWEIKHPEFDLYPTSTISLDEVNSCFYVGAVNLKSNSPFNRLYRFYLDGTKYEIVGDSVPATKFYNGYLYSPLIFNDNQQKFYLQSTVAAGKDSFYLQLYSINNTPVYTDLLNSVRYVEKRSLLDSTYLYIVLALAGAFSLLFISYTKRKFLFTILLKKDNEKTDIKDEIDLNNRIIYRANSIYLFGDFKMFDKNGFEITNEFTPKIKQLFLILFLNTFNPHRTGIHIDELSAILWEEYSNDQVKNNRNVTFSKLRLILNKLNGIEIKNKKGTCHIEITNEFYSDFLEFQTILATNNFTQGKVENLKSIIGRGEFLHRLSYEWLDPFKVNFVDNSVMTLVKLCKNSGFDPSQNSVLADIILILDSVNEDGLSIKVKSLIDVQNHSQAKKVFNNFKKEYFRLFAEEYSKTFEEITN
jgi:DNA-binding SARP family transcriptional activator